MNTLRPADVETKLSIAFVRRLIKTLSTAKCGPAATVCCRFIEDDSVAGFGGRWKKDSTNRAFDKNTGAGDRAGLDAEAEVDVLLIAGVGVKVVRGAAVELITLTEFAADEEAQSYSSEAC